MKQLVAMQGLAQQGNKEIPLPHKIVYNNGECCKQ